MSYVQSTPVISKPEYPLITNTRLYRRNTGPLEFDITGVDCIINCVKLRDYITTLNNTVIVRLS